MNAAQLFCFEGTELEWFIDPEGNPACKAQELGELLGFSPTYVPTLIEKVYPNFRFQSSMGRVGRPFWYLREPGIYQFIFMSKAEIALRFQLWVWEVVLPSIRKTDGYMQPTASPENLQYWQAQTTEMSAQIESKDVQIKAMADHITNEPVRVEQQAAKVCEKELDKRVALLTVDSDAPNGDPVAHLEHIKKEMVKLRAENNLLQVELIKGRSLPGKAHVQSQLVPKQEILKAVRQLGPSTKLGVKLAEMLK
jgi:prophage antirepressor-like protein